LGLDQSVLSLTRSQISDFTSGTVAYSTASGTANTSGTAYFATTAGTAIYANTAGTASYANSAGTANTAGTASYAITSGTAVSISGSITKSQVSDFANGTVAASTALTAQGTASQVLVSNGTAAPSFIDQSAMATFGHSILMSGYWYLPHGLATISNTGTMTQSALGFTPLYIAKSTSINKLGLYVATLAASSTIRLGVFANSTASNSAYPGTLVVDAGSVDSTTTGSKVITLGTAITLNPGLYWLAAVAQGGAPVVYVTVSTITYPHSPMGSASAILGPGSGNNTWTSAGVTGALPGTVGALSLTTRAPLVYFGVA
jgi:hypothetical protein